MQVVQNSFEFIGKTPIQVLNNMSPEGGAKVWAKLEYDTPGASVKDRIAAYMIQKALERGDLKTGGTVIEATAGNTGVGLAVVTAALGYKFICIMPAKFSMEKQKTIEFLGGTVLRTPTEDGMKGAIAKAHKIQSETPNSWVADQFVNTDNPLCHYETTAVEIYEQTKGNLTAFLAGAGTGGTFSGVAKFLKEKNKDIKTYVVEPEGSTIGGGEAGDYWVEGIGNTYIPDTLNMDLADGVYTISDENIKKTIKELAVKEQILGGGSCGANVFAAIELAKTLGPNDIVVTILPDRLERYISKGILDI
ncbi:MAG: cysteine synthase family protein [Candidatus Cloacimonetes bacterium]|nr:cysteine synthase family protein [Candidatus Cloacimonadota bacterium]